MDRKQAQSSIGNNILINEGNDGQYFGVLNDIITPPRKTWRAKVTITAVVRLPSFIEKDGNFQLKPLKYNENEVIECIGSKILMPKAQLDHSFHESLVIAAEQRWKEIQDQHVQIKLKQDTLKSFLSSKQANYMFEDELQTEDEDQPNIFYTFQKRNKRYFLVDERNEQLDLDGCPFEFKWHNEESFTGHYDKDGTFVSNDGIRFSPKVGTTMTLDKKQFEPYFILQNELEPESLHSLEKGLLSFGLKHNNMIECHNSLLGQFLNTTGENTFHGVNILTYRGSKGIVIVLHHFDRKLHDHSEDEIYDRFEFTTEQGKRSIITYTSKVSRK